MLDQKEALRLFEYRDGDLYWKANRFPSKIGKLVGTDHVGYKRVQLNKKGYMVHRVVFLMHKGYMPTIVDHIDGNPANNKIENLRDATYQQNAINVKPRKDSKTKVQNVTFHKYRKKYLVHLHVYGKRKYFGYYDDLELAELVASEARDKYYRSFARQHKCLP